MSEIARGVTMYKYGSRLVFGSVIGLMFGLVSIGGCTTIPDEVYVDRPTVRVGDTIEGTVRVERSEWGPSSIPLRVEPAAAVTPASTTLHVPGGSRFANPFYVQVDKNMGPVLLMAGELNGPTAMVSVVDGAKNISDGSILPQGWVPVSISWSDGNQVAAPGVTEHGKVFMGASDNTAVRWLDLYYYGAPTQAPTSVKVRVPAGSAESETFQTTIGSTSASSMTVVAVERTTLKGTFTTLNIEQ